MSSSNRRWLFLLLVVAVILFLDQTAKYLVIANLQLGESYQLIPPLYPFFEITRSENTGAAFGFIPQAGNLFLIIALVVAAVILYLYPRVPDKARLTRLAMGLVVGGALGNALDRVLHGAVIDFIHYELPGIVSNVSNLADHAIVIGVIIIVIQSWRADSEKAAAEVPEEEPSEPHHS